MLASDLHVEEGGEDIGPSRSRLKVVPAGGEYGQSTSKHTGTGLHPSNRNPLIIGSCEQSRGHHPNPSMGSTHNPIIPGTTSVRSSMASAGSSSVPFKWEEAPGKPIIPSCSSPPHPCPLDLQLPPKLQGPPLSLMDLHSPNFHSPSSLHLHPISPTNYALNHPTNHLNPDQPTTPGGRPPLIRLPSNHPKLKNVLCKFLLKTASWSQPPLHKHTPASHAYSQSWSSSSGGGGPTASHSAARDDPPDDMAINHRFFFDKSSPKDLKYSASMDSCRRPLYAGYRRQDEFVSKEALSFLAMEEDQLHEADSAASSPWQQPISFHDERKGCGCSPWPPMAPNMRVQKRLLLQDDEDEYEGFHDFFSTDSSAEKPSQRTEESVESACSSPCPWYLQFGPEEEGGEGEEVNVERGGRKMVVRLVALVKLKRIISSKVSKLKKRREWANPQGNYTTTYSTMWSPTLATYLYNQQKEERESLDHHPCLDEEGEGEGEGEGDDDAHSNSSSNRLHIDPNYYLPSSIMGHCSPNCSFSEEEKYPYSSHHHLKVATTMTTLPYSFEEEEEEEEPSHLKVATTTIPYNFPQEEEEENEPSQLTHKLSLKEKLVEFDDDHEYPVHFLHPTSTIFSPQHPPIDIKRREATPCKRLCKVQKTVKMLVATIKLILVQTEVRKRKGLQRPLKYGSCINPMASPFRSTHK